MNEADTCRTYVVPKLQAADWEKPKLLALQTQVSARAAESEAGAEALLPSLLGQVLSR